MPLEECPTCGYALSIVDHHCRHCAPALLPGSPQPLFDLKRIPWWMVAAVAIGALSYLIFFR